MVKSMEKIIASKKGLTDIILVLDGNKVIEEYTDDLKARERWLRRKEELKQEKREILHEIDAKPKKKPKIIRVSKVFGRPMRFKK